MTWQANQSQQNGNGQQFQRKIPDPGKGRLRMVDKTKARDPSKAPDFRGLVNCDGHLVEISIWHNPAAQGKNGWMPESFSASVRTFDPNQQNQGQAPQQPVQQQMPYAPPPQPHYQQPQVPPQQGGYAPAPGYHPPQQGYQPQAAPTAPPQPPRWGGSPGMTQQPVAAQGGGIPKSEVPF